MAAAYLGKEGIEVARSIRDDNYLKILYSETGYDGEDSWRSGLSCDPFSGDACPVEAVCGGGCTADYTSLALSTDNVGEKLKYNDSTGLFGYSGSKESLYERTITVTPVADYLNVSVSVEWNDRGKARSLTVEENLYNWWPQ